MNEVDSYLMQDFGQRYAFDIKLKYRNPITLCLKQTKTIEIILFSPFLTKYTAYLIFNMDRYIFLSSSN